MKYENTAILTDLDGTLFNSQGIVSAEARTAIAAYIVTFWRSAISARS